MLPKLSLSQCFQITLFRKQFFSLSGSLVFAASCFFANTCERISSWNTILTLTTAAYLFDDLFGCVVSGWASFVLLSHALASCWTPFWCGWPPILRHKQLLKPNEVAFELLNLCWRQARFVTVIEWFEALELCDSLQRLRKTLLDEVTFHHGRCVLHKSIKSLPGRLCVALPLHFELDKVLIFDFRDAMALYSLHFVPTSFFRLFWLRLWTLDFFVYELV